MRLKALPSPPASLLQACLLQQGELEEYPRTGPLAYGEPRSPWPPSTPCSPRPAPPLKGAVRTEARGGGCVVGGRWGMSKCWVDEWANGGGMTYDSILWVEGWLRVF